MAGRSKACQLPSLSRALRQSLADRQLEHAKSSVYWGLLGDQDRNDIIEAWAALSDAANQVHPIHPRSVQNAFELAARDWQQWRMTELFARPRDIENRLCVLGVADDCSSRQLWRRALHGVEPAGPAIWEPETAERWYGDKNGALPRRHPLFVHVYGGIASDYEPLDYVHEQGAFAADVECQRWHGPDGLTSFASPAAIRIDGSELWLQGEQRITSNDLLKNAGLSDEQIDQLRGA
jgi:hypothetical protein